MARVKSNGKKKTGLNSTGRPRTVVRKNTNISPSQLLEMQFIEPSIAKRKLEATLKFYNEEGQTYSLFIKPSVKERATYIGRGSFAKGVEFAVNMMMYHMADINDFAYRSGKMKFDEALGMLSKKRLIPQKSGARKRQLERERVYAEKNQIDSGDRQEPVYQSGVPAKTSE